MRIALVHEQTRAPRGGATMSTLLARPVGELAEDLRLLGHVVTELRLRRSSRRPLLEPGRSAGSPDATDGGVGPIDVTSGRELSVLRSVGADAVLAVGAPAARVLEDICPGLRAPWVWSPASEELLGDGGAAGTVPSTADRIIVGSRVERARLDAAGVPRSMIDVAPWHLAGGPADSAAVGAEPRLVRTVLTTADTDGEGVADVVRAVALVRGLRLVVAVDPATARDSHRLARWARLAGGLEVADRVRLVRVTSADDVRTLVAGAGMLVSVPRRSLQKELITAAMWSGVPVISSDLDGVRELVETGCSGLVLPPADPRRLARALHVVRRDASSRGLWTRAARRRAIELFSPSETALAVAQALATAGSRELVAQRRLAGMPHRSAFGHRATG